MLYPSGEVEPLRVTEPLTADNDVDLLEIHLYDFFYAIGAHGVRAPDDTMVLSSQWAADVDAAEIFPLVASPPGDLREHIPGREGAVLSVAGYQGADEVWRFETSTDAAHSWRRTDVRLRLGRKQVWRYADASPHAVGPRRLQAIGMADVLPDLPLYLRELWWTDDEKKFRRVTMPWKRMPFGGMAFASDGALLLAEVTVPDSYCKSLTCNWAGQYGGYPRKDGAEATTQRPETVWPLLRGRHRSIRGADRRTHWPTDHSPFARRLLMDRGEPRALGTPASEVRRCISLVGPSNASGQQRCSNTP